MMHLLKKMLAETEKHVPCMKPGYLHLVSTYIFSDVGFNALYATQRPQLLGLAV